MSQVRQVVVAGVSDLNTEELAALKYYAADIFDGDAPRKSLAQWLASDQGGSLLKYCGTTFDITAKGVRAIKHHDAIMRAGKALRSGPSGDAPVERLDPKRFVSASSPR